MDNFIEALYGQPEGTIPEEYDLFVFGLLKLMF